MTTAGDRPPGRLSEIKDAFNEAMELPVDARDAWLRDRCPTGIAGEVRALLDAYARADTFLERPALHDTSAAGALEGVFPVAGAHEVPIGARLGAYVITAHLGDGGMGQVFRARRADDQFDQQVAIKVVRAELATPSMVERLRQERRILAALDHPNIARLLDGGSTDGGLPYAVMELVEGVPIDIYCDQHSLDVRARLALFRDVCGAVQYAHERLVVHRDLKPSNILVTKDGAPKLLDFGISKVLTPDQTDGLRTQTGWWAMTPRYASPEHLRGEAVGVASDVYALGVLAYELLADASPYGVAAALSHVSLEHAILEHEPVPPSRAAPAARQRALRGDLDRIVLKALEKPLERRYANVEQLCDDIDRFSSGRTVSVGPDAWTYRARKFVARHRLGVTAAAAAAVALIAGGATTFYQARIAQRERAIAEQRFDQVRGLANAFVFEFPNAIKDRTGTTAARKEAVTRALAYLDGLSGDNSDDARLLAETTRAYIELGELLGNPYVANLGDPERAEASYSKALARATRLVSLPGATPDHTLLLAQAHMGVGDIRWSKADTAGARIAYQAALDLTMKPAAGADRPALRYVRGHALYLLGQTELKSGRIAAAQPFYQKSLDEAHACLAMPDKTPECSRVLNVAESKLGDVFRLQNDSAQALIHSREASRLSHVSADEEPDRRDLKRLAAFVDIRYATDLGSTGDAAGATAIFAKTCDTMVARANADPSDVQAASDIAVCMGTWARTALEAGDLATSARGFQRTVDALTPLVRDKSHYEYRLELARAYEGFATVNLRRADFDAALAAGERGRALLEPMLAATPTAGPFLADIYDQMIGALEGRARRADRAPADRQADWTSALEFTDRYMALMKTLDAAGQLDASEAGWDRRTTDRAAGARTALARLKSGGM